MKVNVFVDLVDALIALLLKTSLLLVDLDVSEMLHCATHSPVSHCGECDGGF